MSAQISKALPYTGTLLVIAAFVMGLFFGGYRDVH